MSKFCEMCGARLEDDALFCDECGAPQTPASAPAAAQAQPPAQNTAGKGGAPAAPKQGLPMPDFTALILGILAVLAAFAAKSTGIALAVAGVVCGGIALVGSPRNKTLVLAGLAVCAVALVLILLII